jgi:BASS family bile acid:Na+ symporter
MGLMKTVESNMGLLFLAALAIGLLFPEQTSFLNSYAVLLLSTAMFFIFLKIDFSRIIEYSKRPLLLAYIVLVFLVVIPSAVFLVMSLADPAMAVGFLLIFGVPTAATIAVLVELFRGNAPLALLIEFFLYITAPFTLPLLSYYLAGSVISIDALGLFITMIQILIVPMILAQLLKRFANTDGAERYTEIISIAVISLTGLGIMGENSAFILSNLGGILNVVIFLVPLYVAMNIIGYYMAFWLDKKDRLTLSITKTFMNGTLAFVLASQFFGPGVLLVILSNIFVWYAYLGVAKYIRR